MSKLIRKAVDGLASIKKNLHKLLYDLDIKEYHGMAGSFSSSQFKDLLDDQDVFVQKHIHRTIEREENAAFDIGSYFHTGILEPHKLQQDCVVFPGKIRRGAEWEKFKKKNAGRAIVTQAQKEQAETLVRAVKDSPVAQNYLNGRPEVSLIIELVIYDGQIYAPYFGKVLTREGWIKGPVTRPDGVSIYVRVRADMLGVDYISDLKSTGGNARSNKDMRNKISMYHYDLSAALYLDMFCLMLPKVQQFVWIFASKDMGNSRSYLASSNNIRVGRAKYMKALIRLADGIENGWATVDFLDVLEPMPHEMEHLIEKDSDLL